MFRLELICGRRFDVMDFSLVAGAYSVNGEMLRIRRPGKRLDRVIASFRSIGAEHDGLPGAVFGLGVGRTQRDVVVVDKCKPFAVGGCGGMNDTVFRARCGVVTSVVIVIIIV